MRAMGLRKFFSNWRLKKKVKKALKGQPPAVAAKKVSGSKGWKAAARLREIKKEMSKLEQRRMEWDARIIMGKHDYKLEKSRILKSEPYKRWLKKELHEHIKIHWTGSLKKTIKYLIDIYFGYATISTEDRYFIYAQQEYLRNLLKKPKKLKGFKDLHGY